MSLAKTLKGDIIAVDLFEEFLEKLKENSAKENTTANIKTLSASTVSYTHLTLPTILLV